MNANNIDPRTMTDAQVDRLRRINAYVDTNKKSVGGAFLLALLFGPLGVLYASPLAGAILLLISIGVAASGMAVLLVAFWLISVIMAPIMAHSANDALRVKANLIAG